MRPGRPAPAERLLPATVGRGSDGNVIDNNRGTTTPARRKRTRETLTDFSFAI